MAHRSQNTEKLVLIGFLFLVFKVLRCTNVMWQQQRAEYMAMQAVFTCTLLGISGMQNPASVPRAHPVNVVPPCTGFAAPQVMRLSTLGTGSTHHYPDSVCRPLPASVWIPCAGYVAVQAVHVPGIYTLPGFRGIQ